MRNRATPAVPLCWRYEPRADAYARRALLFGRGREHSATAGVDAEAAFGPSTAGCYEADELMDRAAEDLRDRRYRTASKRLRRAVREYRAAGACRDHDLADALYLSGLAAGYLGNTPFAIDALAEGLRLLRAQGRMQAWLSCNIALMAVRVDGNLEPPDPAVFSGLNRVCREQGCDLERLNLRLIVVEGLLRVGDLREARRQLLGLRYQSAAAGEEGLALVCSALRSATPQRSLRLVLGRLTGRSPGTLGEARRLLVAWTDAQATPGQLAQANRAAQLFQMIRPGDRVVAQRRSELAARLAELLRLRPKPQRGGETA
ncbi:MAG: hypothetical protein PVJ57_22105 [Phycisphaerae bacterium]|jgi:hypothetical protein